LADRAVLEVTAQYNDPVVAARIADATLTEVGKAVSRIENGNVKVTAVGPAAVPRESSKLKTLINVAVGALSGFVVGLFVAVGLEFIQQRGGWRPTRPQVR
jgi:capsular polysaccharide biosynthesis protein